MIRYYSANMAGPFHLDEGIPCQDSYFVRRDKAGVVYAGVADGLGSEAHSDVGSRIAVRESILFCMDHYRREMAFSGVKRVMNNAFVGAYKAVLEEAEKAGHPANQYDTTLCLVIFDRGKLYYGQSGDSGAVALMEDGHYRALTTQQRDRDGHVFPLCSGPNKWVFGEVLEPVSSVMVMTDGVWEEINPPLLRQEEVKINVALARRFMDREEESLRSVKALEKAVRTYLENYPRRLIDDDKTIVVLFDPSRPAKRLGEDYYKGPDWASLQKAATARLYPDREGGKRERSLVPLSYWDFYRPL